MTRLSTFSRFAEPCAADSRATCQGCGESFHYESLSDEGFCKDCEPEDESHEET